MKIATKNALRPVFIWVPIMLAVLLIQWIGDLFIGNEIIEQPIYYCALLWMAFAILSGKFEAYYFAHKQSSKVQANVNEHVLFTIIRLVVIIPILVLTTWKAVICYMCLFPFFHDGNYYLMREMLVHGTYPKKWWDQSTTSTAFSTRFFTPVVRTILAAGAVFILIMLRYGYF